MELLDRDNVAVATIPPLPSAAELNKVADSVHAVAHAITINSPVMYMIAVEEMQALQEKLDQLNTTRFAITRPMDQAKNNVMDLFRAPVKKCEDAIALLKSAILTFSKEEKRKAQEAQKLADEQARQERLKLEQQAREQQAAVDRQAREAAAAAQAAAKAEQAAKDAAASGDRDAEERANAEVLAANQTKATAEAEREAAAARVSVTQSIAQVMTAPTVASATPKVVGVSTSAPWTAEVTSLIDLIKFVAANPQYVNFLTPNLVPIKQQAKSLQANCKIDGVRVFQEERLNSRRK